MSNSKSDLEDAITGIFITIDNYGTSEEARIDIRALVAHEKLALLTNITDWTKRGLESDNPDVHYRCLQMIQQEANNIRRSME